MKKIVLDRKRGTAIGPGCPVFIIAEAGVNHNGSLKLAKKLIDVAVSAGADAVKFQTFRAELVVSPETEMAEYQKANTGKVESQLDMIRRLQLKDGDFTVLRDYCRKKGIMFLSTPFDEPSVDLLAKLGVAAFKISSGDVTATPLLERVASKGRPVILSTGMSNMAEVREAVRVLKRAGCKDVVLLHCVTDYPCAAADTNLRAIPAIAKATGCAVGLSDHTLGVAVPLASVALGACVIEKHFTLDRKMPGPDHLASLEPDDLALLVRSVREVEMALGDGIKRLKPSEKTNARIGRRSLHWSRELPSGHVVADDDLVCVCPGNGIVPALKHTVVGRTLKHSVKSFAMVQKGDLFAGPKARKVRQVRR